MKKLILAFFSVVLIASAVFFFSFSSFSEDDGCVVVLNSFKSGLTFEDLVFKESDNAEKCNKNNTLILYTPEEKSALDFVKPLKKKMDKVSFFVSAVVPEKRAEDPAITFSEHRSNDVKAPETDSSEKTPVSVPDKESDFVIYYLYNDPDSSNEELDDALLDLQKNEVNLILTGSYSATQGKNLRHQTLFLESNEKPEFSILVFSILRLENGEKKVIIRSFIRRTE